MEKPEEITNIENDNLDSIAAKENCANEKQEIDNEKQEIEKKIEDKRPQETGESVTHEMEEISIHSFDDSVFEMDEETFSFQSEILDEDLCPNLSEETSIQSSKDSDFNWLERLFPKKQNKIDFILNNEDLISEKQSDLRIIWFEIVLGTLGCLAFIILVIIIAFKSQTQVPKVYFPQIINPLDRGFPTMHLAIVKGDAKEIKHLS